MPTRRLSLFLRHLARGMAAQTMANLSDRQLVEQFLASRDDSVFEVIVRRHGPMVYRVCWRALQQEQDAEDALQATFLVLAQKLHTVRKHSSLASWLHGVAYRVALKAKAQAVSRQRHERAASTSRAVPPDELRWKELRVVLDAELAQLPEKWRLPLILCYLEGRTQEEAAGQLSCSEKTLRRRLDEARAALGRRLSRRGVIWPAALSAVLLSDCVAPAAVKLGLVGPTVDAAARVAGGEPMTAAALVSAKVAALTKGVLKAMLLAKLKIAAAALPLGAFGLGAALMVAQAALMMARGTAPEPQAQEKSVRQPVNVSVAASKELNEEGGLNQQVQEWNWLVTKVDGEKRTISLELPPENPGNQVAVFAGAPVSDLAFKLRGITLQGIAVTEDVKVLIDGREGKLADVQKGMQVTVRMAENGPTIRGIEATAPRRCTLKAIDIEKKTITVSVGAKEWTARVAAGATIVMPGKQEFKLSDLKGGMRVHVQLGVEADKLVVKAIVANSE